MAASASEEDINALFLEASSHIKNIASELTREHLLQFYGFYKQALEGPCTKSKPNWFQVTEKQKWQAWSSLGNMDSKEAMKEYVELLNRLDENWRGSPIEKTTSWVHHSSMKNTEEHIDDTEKTVTDWVKEGNLAMVKSLMQNSEVDVNKLDSDGLSLLHWAADRGNLEMVKHLVEDLEAKVNNKDIEGQTALHYAASCGHEEVVKFLLKSGADGTIKDNDDQMPYELSNNLFIQEILRPFMHMVET